MRNNHLKFSIAILLIYCAWAEKTSSLEPALARPLLKRPKGIFTETTQPHEREPISTLQLDGIAYFDETHWSLWLNGQQYTLDQPPEFCQILRVDAQRITLAWPKGSAPVELKPGETIQQALPTDPSVNLTEAEPLSLEAE